MDKDRTYDRRKIRDYGTVLLVNLFTTLQLKLQAQGISESEIVRWFDAYGEYQLLVQEQWARYKESGCVL
ncbi:hypothetical protein [Vibrio breoganii]|uniref:hypothetical protein n=1 Tax=Vibrio breoganii TaxID=553239 RepID=UPI0010549AE5|nr:hypothetical protein [Vibrio breoganii]